MSADAAPRPALPGGPFATDHDPRGPRVLFLANSLAAGGAERQLARAARGLAARGYDVHVAALLDWVGLQPMLREGGVTLHQLRATGPARVATALTSGRRVARTVAPDVLVAFDYQANVLARLLGRHLGVPVVSSIRGADFGGRSRERIIRATDRWSRWTTTNSRAVADDLVARDLVAPDRLQVVPNAADLEVRPTPDARARLRAELQVGPATALWCMIGHVVPAKDHETALRALATVPAHLDLRVVVAGKVFDADRARVEALALELGVADRFQLLGHRKDAVDLLAAADGLLSSSCTEGLPNAIMEAQLAQLPVVATRVGGTAELVTDEVSGLLVAPRDPVALGRALTRALELPADQRRAMGRAGRAHVTTWCDPEAVLDRWEALVLESVGTRGGAT